MALTYDQAYQATNPADDDAKREQSALALIAGQAANDAYWNSRTELEALKAQADGHGQVVRAEDPTAVGTSTDNAPVIEGTATEEPPAVIGTGSTAADQPPAASSPPEPDNPTAAVAALRKQLSDAGITPEA